MSWHQFIHSNPNVLLGKPVVKGTRISVDFILNLFATGWTKEQVLENYPNISTDSLKSVKNT